MRSYRSRARSWALLILLAGACDGDGATPPPDELLSVAAAPGDAPAGPAGSRLLLVPLAVVTNAAGEPVSGAAVTLSLGGATGAGFALPEERAVSGPDGVVRADVQLGALGTAQVRVAVGGTGDDTEATITVTSATPPTLASVQPTSFGPGDVVQLAGSGFTSEDAGLAVLVGGVRATILEASPTSLRVRAPACVAAGAVPVTVAVGASVTTGAVTATYVAGGAAPSLQPFEAVTVPAARAAECLSLLGGGARYLVVPQFATRDDAPASLRTAIGFQLGAPAAGAVASLAALPPIETLSPQQRLDRSLRLRERGLAPAAAVSGADPVVDVPPLSALTLNSTRRFQVLNDLEGDTYTAVTASLRYIGDDVLVYVDEQAPTGGFTQEQLDGLGGVFDDKLYPAAVRAFGSESDIDDNDHVIVLLSPVVNRLTTPAECQAFGYVTGFFYGLDLLPSQRNSNQGEIFYALVPDPGARTGSCAHSVAEVNRTIPATFIHELQHMISWGQKVLVRNSPVDEELWLNEGLSHVAEEIGLLEYERECAGVLTPPCRTTPDQIFPDSAQSFVDGTYVNAYNYLANAPQTSLTLFLDGGRPEERGGAFLFLRWLGDQKRPEIYRRLVETRMTGIDNLEDKAGEPWARLFGDFSIAAYAADRLPGVAPASLPSRYRFISRDLRQIFRRFSDTGSGGAGPFPIAAGRLPPNGTVTASMVPGTATWYELATDAATPRARITFQPTGAGAFASALGAQVTILRLPNP